MTDSTSIHPPVQRCMTSVSVLYSELRDRSTHRVIQQITKPSTAMKWTINLYQLCLLVNIHLD